MTQQTDPSIPTSGGQPWKLGLLLVLRVSVSVSLLVAAYFLIPTRGSGEGSDVSWLILELFVFAVIVGVQVPAIVKAKHPVLRAVEALAVVVPVYLLIFARIYVSNSLSDTGAFNEPLDLTTGLYFTVTVFATVGFGDIFAQTNGMRLLVTLQMLLNLLVLGLVIRLLTSAARRGVARNEGRADLSDPTATSIEEPDQ
jgi:voltage-gated potassium channel